MYVSESKIGLSISRRKAEKWRCCGGENQSTFRISTRRSSKHGNEIDKPAASADWKYQEQFKRYSITTSIAERFVGNDVEGILEITIILIFKSLE